MTKDNITVRIDSVLYWHIVDPYQAQYGVKDVKKALVERYLSINGIVMHKTNHVSFR